MSRVLRRAEFTDPWRAVGLARSQGFTLLQDGRLAMGAPVLDTDGPNLSARVAGQSIVVSGGQKPYLITNGDGQLATGDIPATNAAYVVRDRAGQTVRVMALFSPSITSPSSISCRQLDTVAFQVTATNSPTSFIATGLPSGLSINTGTGFISGTIAAYGDFTATITATNAQGSDVKTLSIHCVELVLVIAANYAGQSSVLSPWVWQQTNVISGKTLTCAESNGTKWIAACTDGTIHRSDDGLTWINTGKTVAVPGRIAYLDNVVVVTNYFTGLTISLDGGVTWTDYNNVYSGSPKTFNAAYILPIGGGAYRIFTGGQSGTGTGSSMIASADTNAMPIPANPWMQRYHDGSTASVFSVSAGQGSRIIAGTTLGNGNACLAYSDDSGASWTNYDTGYSAANGRSAFYSPTLGLYLFGCTNGGNTGSIISSPTLSAFTQLHTGLGGAIDDWCEIRGHLYCTSNAGGAWEITATNKTSVATGSIQYISGIT